ncbi:MAG: sugar ABC transporter ATP-binding protein [Treponema sp.]|jgi:ABC-type sugar transport system ATPase subunit|nr:sugar ABC transporter ATP-binding protein [Treponema sp.]
MDYRNASPIIEMEDIVKDFTGVRALDGISFDVYPGEVHGIVVENGAGKSTLMKILSGAHAPTTGTITVEKTSYNSLNPSLARILGINIVYQENDLASSMNVFENVHIGEEKTSFPGIMDFKAMRNAVLSQMKDLGISLDIERTIENLSVADQQFVKILKALNVEPRVLIMDEPTSMFNVEDAHKVLELVRRISSRGIGIIYISHFLSEIVQIADRITVIRDGRAVHTYDNPKRDTPLDAITRDMVGRPVELFFEKEAAPIGDVVLEVRDLRLNRDSPKVSFSLRKGEILGFSGMVGSGRTELMRAIAGADPYAEGLILVNGKEAGIHSPVDSIREGIAFITEDRQRLGLMLHASVTENTTLVGLISKIKGFFINPRRHGSLIQYLVDNLRIKTPSLESEVIYLSGGNQQKVVLAKWLYAEQEIYILDEPTRGIDANAKTEFYKLMSRLTKDGKAILLVSSDMPELISMSDRVLVVRSGAIIDELTGADINEHEIVKRALGVNND